MPNMSNLFTITQGVLVYGGASSDNYGMVISEAPSFERPTRKQTVYTVPGRNGAVIYQEDAWEDVSRVYNVWIAENITEDSGGVISGTLAERVDAFEAMLNSKKGYQRLTDDFEPDVYRLAYYEGGGDFTNNMMQYGEASITFVCRPERFLKSGETAETVANADTLNNPTAFTAKPLIKITVPSSNTVTVSAGGNTITAEVSDYLFIDCESMNAYRQTTENKNDKISGAFPVLKPGANVIGITGTVTKVEITPRYFTI